MIPIVQPAGRPADVLLHAVAKLPARHDVRLVVVTRTTPAESAAQQVGALRLGDAVQFASCFHHAEVAALLASAEVAVVPSLYEGFSLPTVEAMACGTPLIATRTEALPEVAGNDGAAGLLVAPGDAGALAAAIARLLDDPSRRARMGKAGRGAERGLRRRGCTPVN